MINDTLDLSRIEAGAMKLDIEAVPVEPLVSASAALVLPAAQQHGVTVEQRVEPGLALQGDATRIKQILTNLLSNAVKYNVDGGRVEVTARRLDERTGLIEVHDTGQGMSREQLGGLFQPFNRLGRDGQIEGTGIGLVISRRLAELMNGQLEADSEPGRGSRFSLRLPLAREALPQAPEPGDAGAGGDGGYHARRVHYVEDNDTNTEVMSGILAQRPQILLTVSRTGAEALAALRHQRPHLVLLDMHLPDIDGLELLRQLKADPDTAPVPVVVVSADATPARIEQALAQGANRYLTKPVNVAEVLALMDELLAMQDTEFGALH
jgi:CheY-like chemotaxis protein